MTTTLRSNIKVEFGWTWRDHAGGLAVVDSNRVAAACELTDGGGPDQADVAWSAAEQSLAAGASVVYALGALERPLFGDTIAVRFGTVRGLLVVNRNTAGDGLLLVGGAGGGEWSAPFGMVGDTLRVMPGSPLVLAHVRDGWPVDPGGDRLKLTAIDDAVSYDIVVLGNLAGGSSGGGSSGSSGSSGG